MSQRFQFSFEPTDDFTLDDFRRALANMAKLTKIEDVISLLPSSSVLKFTMNDVIARTRGEKREIRRLQGIIDSMTSQERHDSLSTIDDSRRRRIAAGAGVELTEVAQFFKQFDRLAATMRRMRKPQPGELN